MRSLIIIAIYCCAAIAPLADWHSTDAQKDRPFPGWPAELHGRELTPLPMTAQEQGFNQGFPGKIGRFNDGIRDVIIRYVERPTRNLHPSADCLRGAGFNISNQPLWRDAQNLLWGCVLAERGGESYRVCEHIRDDNGNGWYDVSSWFWSAVFNNGKGPWWAVTVAERV